MCLNLIRELTVLQLRNCTKILPLILTICIYSFYIMFALCVKMVFNFLNVFVLVLNASSMFHFSLYRQWWIENVDMTNFNIKIKTQIFITLTGAHKRKGTIASQIHPCEAAIIYQSFQLIHNSWWNPTRK